MKDIKLVNHCENRLINVSITNIYRYVKEPEHKFI